MACYKIQWPGSSETNCSFTWLLQDIALWKGPSLWSPSQHQFPYEKNESIMLWTKLITRTSCGFTFCHLSLISHVDPYDRWIYLHMSTSCNMQSFSINTICQDPKKIKSNTWTYRKQFLPISIKEKTSTGKRPSHTTIKKLLY